MVLRRNDHYKRVPIRLSHQKSLGSKYWPRGKLSWRLGKSGRHFPGMSKPSWRCTRCTWHSFAVLEFQPRSICGGTKTEEESYWSLECLLDCQGSCSTYRKWSAHLPKMVWASCRQRWIIGRGSSKTRISNPGTERRAWKLRWNRSLARRYEILCRQVLK